jgi:hypothetical protein
MKLNLVFHEVLKFGKKSAKIESANLKTIEAEEPIKTFEVLKLGYEGTVKRKN